MKNLYLAVLAAALTPSFLLAQDEPRTYVAQFTSNPPTIDGVLTSDSEWSLAESAGGSWTMLGTTLGDPTDNRFNILWDEEGMYVRHLVADTNWAKPPIGSGSIDWFYDTLNLYLDPNTDGETNANLGPDDTGVDGYLIAMNQPLGFSQRTAEDPQLFVYEQAHVDSLFGNQHLFAGFAGIEIAQTTSDRESFGYTEMYIPWEDFNSSDPEVWDDATQDTGLFHPYAPFDGEQWFFNFARIQTDGSIPAWVTTPGIGLLPARPHGILQFSRDSPQDPGDINGDGVCDALDIDALAKAIREQQTDDLYDVDTDGDVDWDDHAYMVEVLHDTYFGDSNLDLVFDSGDFVTVFIAGLYDNGIPLDALWASGDWNGDGDFDSSDFVKAFIANGYDRGKRSDLRLPVPEPSGMLLLVVGLVCLIRRRRL